MDVILEKLQALPGLLIVYSPFFILGLIIFIVGRIIVRKAAKTTTSTVEKMPQMDSTLARFFGSLVMFAGMAAVIILALTTMKVNLAFLATVIGAMVLALGFALQESLGDFASGIMLALFRPFKVGDEVEIAGEHGVVQDTSLMSTELVTRDNIQITVGNGAVFGNTIKNYYTFGDRRLDMDFGVAYGADLNAAIKAVKSAADGDDRIKVDPEPWAKVTALGDSAVNIQLRVWCLADDYRKIQMDISARVREALNRAKIEIPYEHNVIVRKKG